MNSMKIPFFDYKRLYKDQRNELIEIIDKVSSNGSFIMQSELKEFEENLAKFNNVNYAVGVANATDGLELITNSIGIKKGDEVICSSHTMLATASAAKTAGLQPLPVNVCENSLMLEREQLENLDLTDVSACMITQLNGVVANMDPISEFCKKKKIQLIEDSAQAIGSFNNNKHAGSWGVGGCISFYPAKIVGSLGDGGAIITNNDELCKFAKSVRDHGRGIGLEADNWGRNSRLDSINARIILERLNNLNVLIQKRRKLASIYNQELRILEKLEYIKLPPKYSSNSESESTYQNYEIQASNRDKLKSFLRDNNIGTIIQWGGYSIAHFRKLGYNIEDYKLAEHLFEKLLLLPMNHLMKEEDIIQICKFIKKFYT